MKKTIPPNSFDFVSDDIVNCWTHSKKHAFSFCKDCNTFCCDQDDCGRPHMFHNMDNLEACMKKDINPILNDFLLKNNRLYETEKEHSNNIKNLRIFKQNLDNFIQQEKQTTHKSIENIKSQLTNLYLKYEQEMQEMYDNLKIQFDSLEQSTRKQITYPSEFIQVKNNMIKLLSLCNEKSERKKDHFILEFSRISKEMKKNLSTFQIENRFNFHDELEKLKLVVQKDYDNFLGKKMMDNAEKTMTDSNNHYSKLLVEKQRKVQEIHNESRSSMKKFISFRKSVRKEKVIDLDLLFRDIAQQVTNFRLNPNEFFSKLKEEGNINHNLFEPLIRAVNGKSFKKLEWDCDLAESADKYLLKYPNDYLENFKEMKGKMREIMLDIFEYEVYDCNFILISPEEKNIMLQFLQKWQLYNNLLFENYNLIGISGIQVKNNLIAVVINLAHFQINN